MCAFQHANEFMELLFYPSDTLAFLFHSNILRGDSTLNI